VMRECLNIWRTILALYMRIAAKIDQNFCLMTPFPSYINWKEAPASKLSMAAKPERLFKIFIDLLEEPVEKVGYG